MLRSIISLGYKAYHPIRCAIPNQLVFSCNPWTGVGLIRLTSSQQATTQGEQDLTEKLREKFPDASYVEVRDVSGGCGQMYEVYVASPSFKGKSTLEQHKMVNEALKEDIPHFHGIRVETAVN